MAGSNINVGYIRRQFNNALRHTIHTPELLHSLYGNFMNFNILHRNGLDLAFFQSAKNTVFKIPETTSHIANFYKEIPTNYIEAITTIAAKSYSFARLMNIKRTNFFVPYITTFLKREGGEGKNDFSYDKISYKIENIQEKDGNFEITASPEMLGKAKSGIVRDVFRRLECEGVILRERHLQKLISLSSKLNNLDISAGPSYI